MYSCEGLLLLVLATGIVSVCDNALTNEQNSLSTRDKRSAPTPPLPPHHVEDVQLVSGSAPQPQTSATGRSKVTDEADEFDKESKANATEGREVHGRLKADEDSEGENAVEGQEGGEAGERGEGEACKDPGCLQAKAKCPEGCEGHGAEREGEAGAEKEEGPEAGEHETGNEALEEHIEDLMEQYRHLGQTESLSQLMTMFPGLNMSAILADAMSDGAEGEEMERKGVHRQQHRQPEDHHLQPTHSLAPDPYGDYDVVIANRGTPPSSQAPSPRGKQAPPSPQPAQPDIAPTPVLRHGSPNTEAGAAQLVDPGSRPDLHGNQPPAPAPERVGLTTSGTVGVVLGTVVLSWLLAGPALCLAWRWNQRRRERRKVVLQRAATGSVDDGILQAMVHSELGRRDRQVKRRQASQDVDTALTGDQCELQSLPCAESHVI